MQKKLLHIVLFSLLAINIACNEVIGPEIIKEAQIESEMKWVVDNISLEKQFLFSEKTYDKQGNILMYLLYYSTGDLQCESLYSYTGNKSTEKKKHYDSDGDLVDETDITYLFDNDGKILDKKTNNSDGELLNHETFTYDSYGNLIEWVETDNVEKKTSTKNYEYIYTDSGTLLEKVGSSNDHQFFVRDSIVYSSNENKIDLISFDEAGNINIITSYIYNPNGKIHLEIESDSEGTIKKTYLFEYKYFL